MREDVLRGTTAASGYLTSPISAILLTNLIKGELRVPISWYYSLPIAGPSDPAHSHWKRYSVGRVVKRAWSIVISAL